MNQTISQLAAQITKEESFFAYQISNLLFLKNKKSILHYCYAYFRWVDDQVDNTTLPEQEIQIFIKRQCELINSWYDGLAMKPITLFEEMAFLAIQEDINQGKRLKNMVISFLNALAWDAQRKYKIVDRAQLNRYSFWLGNAYAEGLLYGMGADPGNCDYWIPKVFCGIAAHRTHILRDLRIDLKIGYLNIPIEGLNIFSIELEKPRINHFWIKQKAIETKWLFEKGLEKRHLLPSKKAQLIFCLYCRKYILTLEKVLTQLRKENVVEIPEIFFKES